MKISQHAKSRYTHHRVAVANKKALERAAEFKSEHYDTRLGSDSYFRFIKKNTAVLMSGTTNSWRAGMAFRMIAGIISKQPLHNEVVLNYSETNLTELKFKGHSTPVVRFRDIFTFEDLTSSIETAVNHSRELGYPVRFVVLDDLQMYFTPTDQDNPNMQFGLERSKLMPKLLAFTRNLGINIFVAHILNRNARSETGAAYEDFPASYVSFQFDEVYVNHRRHGGYVVSLKNKARNRMPPKNNVATNIFSQQVDKFGKRNFNPR
jgi:hypothetical protein